MLCLAFVLVAARPGGERKHERETVNRKLLLFCAFVHACVSVVPLKHIWFAIFVLQVYAKSRLSLMRLLLPSSNLFLTPAHVYTKTTGNVSSNL